jgi:hypothetical protein
MKEMIDSAMGRECVTIIDKNGITRVQFLKMVYWPWNVTWAEAFANACKRPSNGTWPKLSEGSDPKTREDE